MNVLASKGQLRASFVRWSLFMVPLILLIGFVAGGAGSPDTAWFAGLAKPSIFPPTIAFPIVWSTLFVMIGFACASVGSAWGAAGRGTALIAFAFHFAGTQAWTGVFFGMQDMVGGLMVLGFGVATLLVVIALFWRVRRVAGVLLVPYLAWLMFASVLNYQFLAVNPDGGDRGASGAAARIDLGAR